MKSIRRIDFMCKEIFFVLAKDMEPMCRIDFLCKMGIVSLIKITVCHFTQKVDAPHQFHVLNNIILDVHRVSFCA